MMKPSSKSYRILSSNLAVVESDGKNWKKSGVKFPEAIEAIELFKQNKNLKYLVDSKNPMFLKGQLSDGNVVGARINILPNGEKLDKAFSLFSPKLKIHDEKSNSHWDVIYQNPNGEFAYLYTLAKENISKKQKYKKVEEFEKCLKKLKKNLNKDLTDNPLVLPMIIQV